MLATVAAGNHEALKLIIKHHPSGSRAASKMLYTSCKDACLKDVAMLVRAGADINVGQRGWTPLMRAVVSNAASIVQMLLDKGASPNLANGSGEMPLLHRAAVSKSGSHLIKMLLAAGANPLAAMRSNGLIPVQLAMRASHSRAHEAVDVLLREVTYPKRVARAHVRCMQLCGVPEVELLLSRHVFISLTSMLHLVLRRDKLRQDPALVELLISKGVDLEARVSGHTALHHALLSGANERVLKFLIDRGANTHTTSSSTESDEMEGYTYLHCAAHGNSPKAFEIVSLQARVIDVCAGEAEETALHIACRRNNFAAAQALVAAGARCNIRDARGKTPMHYAREDNVLQLLISAGSDPLARDNDGRTLLQLLRDSRYPGKRPAMVLRLLQHGAGEVMDLSTFLHYSLRCCVCTSGAHKLYSCLLRMARKQQKQGGEENDEHQKGAGGVEEEREEEEQEQRQPVINVNTKDRKGKVPLHLVKTRRQAEDLLAAGAHVNVQDFRGKTALHLCVERRDGDEGIVPLLLAHGANVNAKSRLQETPLHRAISCAHGSIRALIQAGADVEAQDIHGRTPLHMACLCESIENVAVLLSAGADPNARDRSGKAPLHSAMQHSKRILLSTMLLSAGADIDAMDQIGNSPVMLACRHNDARCVMNFVDQHNTMVGLRTASRYLSKRCREGVPRKVVERLERFESLLASYTRLYNLRHGTSRVVEDWKEDFSDSRYAKLQRGVQRMEAEVDSFVKRLETAANDILHVVEKFTEAPPRPAELNNMSRMMLVADNTLSEKSTVAADAALNLLHDSHASPGMLKDYAMSIRSGLLTCRLDEEVERWRTHYSSPFECVLCCQKFGQGFSVSALFHSCDHGASSCSSCLDRYINDICLKDTMGHFTEHGVRCWNSGCSCSLPSLSSRPGPKYLKRELRRTFLPLLCEPIVTADGVPMVRAMPSSGEKPRSVRVPNVSR